MIQENISLKELTNYKIGGPASFYCEIKSLEDLKTCFTDWQEIKKENDRIFILGGGTNLLVADEGFNGLVIHNKIDYIKKIDENTLEVGSGTSVEKLISFCLENSLSGFEWAGGLPGTVGGAVFGNAGAFGGETKDSVLEVKSFAIDGFKEKSRVNGDCNFEYRSSIFKKELAGKEVITAITFKLKVSEREKIEKEVKSHIEYRKERQPIEMPCAGSTFKNVPLKNIPQRWQEVYKEKIKNDPFPVIPAAVFISEAGLIGKQVGGAQVSSKHPNFFVNTGEAKASDVSELINFVQQEVKGKFAIDLEPEIIKLS